MKSTAPPLQAVIAAHNEAGAIHDVLTRLRAQLGEDDSILVVDDGSTDGTADVARAAGADVLRSDVNRGKGAAMRLGIAASRGEWLVFIDADGQDDPAELPTLLAARAHADLVNGSRFMGTLEAGSIHAANRVGNVVLTRLFALLFGQPITDSQAGFRLVRGDVARALDLRGDEYEFETEVLAHLLTGGKRVVEVPVTRYPRAAGATDFKRVRNGLRILGTMVVERARASRRSPSP